jgi:hypothetical protein
LTNSALRSLLISRRGNYCEICVFPRAPLDVHHFLVHDQKRFHQELTTEENCALVCRDCHRWVNGHKERLAFLKAQVTRFGVDHMRSWYRKLPEKILKTGDYDWIGIELDSI